MPRMCPRCQQTYVSIVWLKQLGQRVHLCEACDALWQVDTPIAVETFTDFDTSMRRYGYAGD